MVKFRKDNVAMIKVEKKVKSENSKQRYERKQTETPHSRTPRLVSSNQLF